MKDRTAAEIFATLFFASIAASGGVARQAGVAIRGAIADGAVTDKDARSFLTGLAEVAEQAEGGLH
jgi:hypothetical protein